MRQSRAVTAARRQRRRLKFEVRPRTLSRAWLWPLLIAAAVTGADLATKFWARSHLIADRLSHGGGLRLRLVTNRGAAWGLGSSSPTWVAGVEVGGVAPYPPYFNLADIAIRGGLVVAAVLTVVRRPGLLPPSNRTRRAGRRMTMTTYAATVNGAVIARSDRTVLIEGNRYFPPDSILDEHFTRTRMKSLCPWKGIASYYTLTVDGVRQRNAAWTYRHPSPLARKIKDHVTFWDAGSVTEE